MTIWREIDEEDFDVFVTPKGKPSMYPQNAADRITARRVRLWEKRLGLKLPCPTCKRVICCCAKEGDK